MRRKWPLAAALLIMMAMATPAPGQSAGANGEEESGREAGRAAASSLDGGWFGKGVIGGLIGGPIGTGVVFSLAGRSRAEVPPHVAPDLEGGSPVFSRAFREAYEEQRRLKRKESAFVGGMLGTVVWTWAILRAADLIGGGSIEGDPPDPQPGF